MKRVENCQFLATERTQGALSRKGFQIEKLRRAGKGPDLNVLICKKTFGMFYESRWYHPHLIPSFTSEYVPVKMGLSVSTKYSKTIKQTVRKKECGRKKGRSVERSCQ